MATNNTQDQKPKYASILMDPDRVIHGADFLEEHATNRSLPGIPPYAGASYLTTDVAAAQVDYKSEEDGWIHYPSERVLKRRARAVERRKERQGWLGGNLAGSLREPETPITLAAL